MGAFDGALTILGGGTSTPDGSWQIPPEVQAQRDRDRLSMLQAELSNESDPANRTALQREISHTSQSIQSNSTQGVSGKFAGALGILSGQIPSANQPPTTPATSTNQAKTEPGLWDKAVGAGEAGWSMLTSIPAMVPGAIAGASSILTNGKYGTQAGVDEAAKRFHDVANEYTFQPRTQLGQQYLDKVGQAVNDSGVIALGPVAGDVGLLSQGAKPLSNLLKTGAQEQVSRVLPAKQTPALTRIEPTLAPTPDMSTIKPRVKLNVDGSTTPVDTPSSAAQPSSATAPQSQTAAAPATTPNLQNASPETQAAVANMQKKGVPIDQDVLNRHIEAETLPVPIKLTEGQATLDPTLISEEMNGRGKSNPTVSPDFYNQQGKNLAANLDVIRNNVAPDIAASHPTELGQTLVDRYKMMDQPVLADIDAKYQELRDANGGQFPVDAGQLLTNVQNALKKLLLSNDAPPSQMAELQRLAKEGNMSFEDFLSLRKNLGNVARTSTDGNVRTAAGAMIEQLENLPLSPEAANLKPLADAARSAAKARFDRLKADPAYNAAVNDGVAIGEPSPLADKLITSYVTGSNARVANIKQMKVNLGNDPVANQVIAASTVDRLAGLAKGDQQTGKFLADKYGAGVTDLSPKLNDLVGEQAARHLQQVGNVATYTKAQPAGSYVNNSNTLVGAMSDAAKKGLSAFAASKTMGASTLAEGGLKYYKDAQAAKRATAPAAGVRIKDLPK